jgi:methyl-accepting chemotaxis protein
MSLLPFRRRRIIVHGLQYQLLGFNLLYFLTIVAFIAVALFVPLIIRMDINTASLSEKEQAATQFLFIGTWLWPTLVVAFVLLAIHSVLVSHRIAGPLYRFRAILKSVTEGDLSVRVTLRKNDYMEEEADVINAMIATLGAKMRAIQERYEDMQTALTELKTATDTGVSKEINQNIESLGVQMEQLRIHLEQFKMTAAGTCLKGDDTGDRVSIPPSESRQRLPVSR